MYSVCVLQVKYEFRLKSFNLTMVDIQFWLSFRARRQKKLRINLQVKEILIWNQI